jgi:thioredoxin
MKNTFAGILFISLIWFSSCGSSATTETKPADNQGATIENQPVAETPASSTEPASNPAGKVVQLSKQMFLDQVFDYEKNPDKWTFKGQQPCIIDFYADWCRPCKMVAPIMEELAEKYKGQITIYKVNTDQERELAQFFGIRSIPSILFCPMGGDPQMSQGAMQKADYEKIINDFLLKKK